MVLYKKVFPLGEGISFSQYVTAIRKEYFSNFVITIDKIPSTENYRAQIFFTAPLWKWGLANIFHEGVFLNNCNILYSEDEEYFILQASAKPINLFVATCFIISAILFLVSVIYIIDTNSVMSFNNILGFAIIIILLLSPPIFIYLRDKRLLDKVGSIGKKLENT